MAVFGWNRPAGGGLYALWAVGGLLVLGSCSRADSAPRARQYPYQAVCTVGMVADIVQQISGDKAAIKAIIGAGVDPHLYKATRNDIAALQRADIVFYSGLLLEGKMGDVLEKVAQSGKPVYAVTRLLDERFLLKMGGHHDPHVWMDVSAWSKAVAAVGQALGEFDPAHRTDYEGNAQRYMAELDQLHEYARQVLGSIPARQRVLITAHDAFNYFGRAYNMEVQGIQGISTESEAGLDDIQRLVSLIVDSDVQAVFVETSVADKNVRALVEGAAARGKAVRIGGSLFSDAMGPAGTYEGTYLGMLDHNATVVARALGGEAPPRGLSGKLAQER